MVQKKITGLAIILCILSVVLFANSAVGYVPAADSPPREDTAQKYSPPITLTAYGFFGPHMRYKDGEDENDNIWTRAYKEKLGVRLKYIWTTTEFYSYEIKVNMAIASDSIPDILPMYSTLFFRALDSWRLADLTSAYNKYMIKELKDLMNGNKGVGIKNCTRDGKIYAIASPPSSQYGGDMLWIRTDWLKNLKLQPPKNMNDVNKIAKSFANSDPDKDKKKDTFGIAVDKNLKLLDGFFNGYHAYRNIWVEKNGKLIRGEIQPEAKTALAKLAELYREGAIDEEFVLKNYEDLKCDFADQKLGMIYSGPSAPEDFLSHTIKSNPKAEWSSYLIPSCDDKPALCQADSKISNFFVASRECKYPEVIIKLANLQYTIEHGPSSESRAYFRDAGIDTFQYPIVRIDDPLYMYTSQDNIVKALKSKDTSRLDGRQLECYQRIVTWTNKKNTDGWAAYKMYGAGGSLGMSRQIKDRKLYYSDRGWGPETPEWTEVGPNLGYMQTENFIYIIIGEKGMKGFDEWVKYFNDYGGMQATREINEWYKSNKQ